MMSYGGFHSAKGAEIITKVSKTEMLVDLLYEQGFAVKENKQTFMKRKGKVTKLTCKNFELYVK
jgi:hypothetical protein